MSRDQPRLLLIAPYYDRNVPSESWSTYKWVSGISERYETTVLTTHRQGWRAAQSPVRAEVVNWVEPKLPDKLRHVDYGVRPQYALFIARVRHWFRRQQQAGDHFDLVHQVNPTALRYPYPLLGHSVPYLIGPLCGSVRTPEGFRDEHFEHRWYGGLRNVDYLRIKWDPWLRASYSRASILMGAAPYVEELLSGMRLKRFVAMGETGVDGVVAQPKTLPTSDEPVRLLFVGRVIRAKGVIDAIRAVAIAKSRCRIEFNIVGGGPMLDECKEEASRLGVNDVVHFRGRVPRDEVTRWYEQSHAFLFPSLREPSGNVVFEAMSSGLPVITSTGGGPGFVVTDENGIRVEPTSPSAYVAGLVRAICELVEDPEAFRRRSKAALARMEDIAIWPRKIDQLSELYADVLGASNATEHVRAGALAHGAG